MFGQWRHAVENTLAQHASKPSQDGKNANEESPTRGSLDAAGIRQSLSSSSQLADSALSTLRKTLVLQRPASPARSTSSSDDQPRPRTTLEDRLKAKFAIGEASNGTSPNPSVRSTPSNTPTPVTDHPLSPRPSESQPLSPRSIPLPDSPSGSVIIASPVPTTLGVPHPLSAAFDTPSTFHLDQGDSADGPSGSPPAVIDNADTSAGPTVESPSSQEDTSPPSDASELTHDEAKDPSDVAEESQPSTGSTPPVQAADQLPDAAEDSETPLASDTQPPDVVEVPPTSSTPPDPAAPAQTAGSDPKPVQESGPESEEATAMTLQPEVDEDAVEPPPSDTKANVADDILPAQVDEPVSEAVDGEVSLSQSEVVSQAKDGVDVESLQQRLKLVEQRFADVSTSFKRLQAEKVAADRVLQELTPVESITDVESLRDFIQNMNLKTEMAQDEIKRLSGKLTRQEERIEELRDIHRLESKSQSEQIHKLVAQVSEAESLLKASQSSVTHLEAESAKHKAEIERLRTEAEKTKASVKDEEEKRTKAVSLLKTVRQKLVKAEKERDDATKEIHALKDQQKDEQAKEKAERLKLQDEIQKVNAERETAVQGLKAQFDKEVATLKDKHEKEISALRGQYELEMITLKSLHSKETEANNSRISDLEASVRILTTEKDEIFDQLQMRQAELESSQSHLESLQSQTVELQYQLRESTDRIALLTDELAEARKERVANTQGSPPAEEVTRLLAATETKYEARIADLRRQMAAVERERDEGEALFNKRLSEKAKEVEQLQSLINISARGREEEGENVVALQKEIDSLREASKVREQLITELQAEAGKITEVEAAAQAQIADIKTTVSILQQQLEEAKAREGQQRAQNKTLREELRKVQSSAALLERQRNPGVGYWAAKGDSAEQRSPTSSTPDLVRDSPSRPSSPSTSRSDEEVNYEYLRNVILQFLEHKEMRPHLVRILSTILRFTPQETRRLIAKV